MGGAVSSGESNDDLVDNLLEADYIKSPLVERVFRAVDRALYYTQAYKSNAYKDLAWKDGNLHLSAPCIYSEVMENLKLEPGMSFLNMGSGTGYLSTMCGLIIGQGGVNHGIELYAEVAEYAREKLEEFLKVSPAIDMFDFCPPDFVVGNCLDQILSQQRYDRIYCGAACPEECIRNITDLLKVGGVCVIPINDSLVQITRVSDDKDDRKSLLPVSFATLIAPRNGIERKSVILPDWKLPTLKELCRSEIRLIIRKTIAPIETKRPTEDGRKRRRRRRQERRRASRLLVVQRRRSGAEDEETGFVAVAYSLGNNSSDEDGDNAEGRDRLSSSQDEENGRHSDNDQEMRSRNHASSDTTSDDNDDDDDDVDLPALEPISLPHRETLVGHNNNGVHSSTTLNSNRPRGNSENNTDTGESNNAGNSSTVTSSGGAPTRSRGAVGRGRNARVNGSDGIFGRLREIYRRRDQVRSSDLLRQVEQNLQQISSRTAQIRQMVAGANNIGIGANSNNNASASPPSGSRGSQDIPMDEEENNTAGNSSRMNSQSSVRNRNTDDSCVWSTDSSLESSSDTTSDDDDDNERLRGGNQESHQNANGSIESGVVTDTDKQNDSGIQTGNLRTLEKLKTNPFSIQMRSKIDQLLLPPSVKLYLNYNRPLGDI